MAEAPARPWRRLADGAELRIRLTPRSSKDVIDGLEETAAGQAFKARVRAVPSEGEANAAIALLVARWLGVPKSTVALAHGGTSRIKTLRVTGDPAALDERLAVLWQNLVAH